MMYGSKYRQDWAPEPVDAGAWTELFGKLLLDAQNQTRYRNLGELEWAFSVSDSIVKSVNSTIMPSVRQNSPTQSKLNALHALIEIATAITYAPKSEVLDAVRSSRVPKFLMDEMFKVIDVMSDLDIKRVATKEKAFASKVAELRHQPRILWEGNMWTDLDEVSRVFKGPGPINFRRVYQNIRTNIYESRKGPKRAMNVIQKEVLDCIDSDTCFETRYNAINFLVDTAVFLGQ